MKKLLAVIPFVLSLAWANVDPHWIKSVDVDGDGKKDYIATGNLSEVVFNEKGEVIGWYVKTYAGNNLISEKDGNVNVDKLKAAPNWVSGKKALEIPLQGKYTAQEPQLTNPTTVPEVMTGVFRYTQGNAIITKTIVVKPRRYTLEVNTKVEGLDSYKMQFHGLEKLTNPNMKAVSVGSQQVLTSGTVQNIQYASMQGSQNSVAPAMIVAPLEGTKANATLNGAQIVLGLKGESNLRVYGGQNNAIRLHLENYNQYPGLFQSNLLGTLGIWIADLLNILYGFTKDWGLAIVLLTIIIRLVMWPLMTAQYKSMAEIQAIQPEINKLNEKYKDDQQKRGEATMKLYQEHGVNPFSGCLPMFVPLPILIVLWQVFSKFEFTSGFLWMPDLSIPDPTYIMVVLYISSMLLQAWISTRKNPEMFKQQLIMQVVFVYIALQFPSGVTLYYTLFTLLSLGQQFLVNKQVENHMAKKNVSKA